MGIGSIRFYAFLATILVAGCSGAYHGEAPPGPAVGSVVQMRNAAGESRWCPARTGDPGSAAGAVGASTMFAPGLIPLVGLAAELVIDALTPTTQASAHEACVSRQRALGFELVEQVPAPARAQQPPQ